MTQQQGVTSQQVFNMLMESQYWPQEQMQAYQRSQLEQMLHHAKKNVPFYRTRIDCLFQQDGSINWERWGEVPILMRSDLEKEQVNMQASRPSPGHGYVFSESTSGTTGTPISVSHTSLEISIIEANDYRAFEWHGLDYDRNRLRWFGNNMSVDVYPAGGDTGPWGPPWNSPPGRGRSLSLNRGVPAEDVVRFMRDNDVTYLAARPEAAQSLANAAQRLGISHPLHKILSFSATLTLGQREDCREAFGAGFVALYSSKEGTRMAYSCPHSDKYHVHAESVLVEILDERNLPVRPGEAGKVVITPFFNSAQPLIRYDHGDIAVRGEHCGCGRHLPVIDSISGRAFHMFKFPDGKLVAPWVPHIERRLLGTSNIQVAQTGPWDIEIRYVPNAAPSEADKSAFLALAQKAIHQMASVKLVELSVLPLSPSGKFLEYVREWRPEERN